MLVPVMFGGLMVLPLVVALLFWLDEKQPHPRTAGFPYVVMEIGTLTMVALLAPFPGKPNRDGRLVRPSSDIPPTAIERRFAPVFAQERLGEPLRRPTLTRDDKAHEVLSFPWTGENFYRGKGGKKGLTLSNNDPAGTAFTFPREFFKEFDGGSTALFFQDSRRGVSTIDLSSVEQLVISLTAADPGWVELHVFVSPAHGYSYRVGTFELGGGPQEISVPVEAIRRLINRGYKDYASAYKDRISGLGLNFSAGIDDPRQPTLKGPNRHPLRLRIERVVGIAKAPEPRGPGVQENRADAMPSAARVRT